MADILASDPGSPICAFDISTKSALEVQAAEKLLGGIHTYERVGYDCRPMMFLPDGTIGLGGAGREMVWNIHSLAEQIVLDIGSLSELTCRLMQTEDGTWHGQWLQGEQMPIVVSPATCLLPAPLENEKLLGPNPKFSAAKAHEGGMYVREWSARVYTHDCGNFKHLTGANILIYFPHGFGDWVQLSCILPLMHPSNKYWMVRFGDDYTAVMENSRFVTPVYLGINPIQCSDGGAFHNTHFGLSEDACDGSVRRLSIPLSLYDFCQTHEIDTVLFLPYPEVWGHVEFPFHTKARHMLPYLIDPTWLNSRTIARPLKSAISFEVDPKVMNWVRTRLQNFAGYGGRKLCLISRNGYTSCGKNWGHLWREELPVGQQREGEECRDFMRLLLHKDPHWMFLVMEDALYSGDDTVRSEALNAYSFVQLFGHSSTNSLPFGLVLKALMNMADLSIGVPTGPYHLSMIKPDLPTVGIWIEHLPSWYDEPKDASVHVISRNIREHKLDKLPGSFPHCGELRYKCHWQDTRVITGQQVLEAVESLIY